MTFLYKLGYDSPEECNFVVLHHDKPFDDDEFEALILSVLPDAPPRLEAERTGSRLLDVIGAQPTWKNLYKVVAALLCERHGFRNAAYAARFVSFGWPDLSSEANLRDGYDFERQKRMVAAVRSGAKK